MLGVAHSRGGRLQSFCEMIHAVIFEVIMTYFDIFKLHQVMRNKKSTTFCCYVVC